METLKINTTVSDDIFNHAFNLLRSTSLENTNNVLSVIEPIVQATKDSIDWKAVRLLEAVELRKRIYAGVQ